MYHIINVPTTVRGPRQGLSIVILPDLAAGAVHQAVIPFLGSTPMLQVSRAGHFQKKLVSLDTWLRLGTAALASPFGPLAAPLLHDTFALAHGLLLTPLACLWGIDEVSVRHRRSRQTFVRPSRASE